MTSNDLPTSDEAAPVAPPAAETTAPATEAAHDEATDAGDAGEGEGDEQASDASASADGAPKKRRRRRRKKKAGEGAEGAANAEAQPSGEAASAEGEGQHHEHGKREPRRKPRPQEPRERPAFSVGDVVFGKIVEITDDYLMVDLSGKGRAIFDRLELDLPEEPAQGPGSEVDDDDDLPPPKPKSEGASSEAAEPSEASTEGVEAAEGEAETADSSEQVDSESPKAEPKPEPVAVVTLPPVDLTLGANFVGVVHNDGGRGGLVVLTRHPRRARAKKSAVAAALREKTTIVGLVTGAIKGGIEVDIEGLRAFAPASHVELRPGHGLAHLVGKRLPFQVTQYAKRGRDIVLSRKDMIEAEAKVQREEAMKRVVVGSTVDGVVRSVVTFGAFVDIGGIEGLVPLTEMSHDRGDRPSDVFSVGETVPVQIQRIDVKGKIWLSRKATLPDPWAEVAAKYPEGSRHKGRVVRLQPFGAFIELERGIDGLIHTADLSVKRIEHPSEVVKVGDEIDVVVAHVDASSHRVALHPVPEGAAEGEVVQRVAPHKILKVEVTQIDPGGLQVRILGASGRQARGFITAAATNTARGTDLRKSFPVGTQLDAKVVEIDPRRGEVKLSIKAMTEQTERDAYKAYKAQVTKEAKFGTLGDLLKKK